MIGEDDEIPTVSLRLRRSDADRELIELRTVDDAGVKRPLDLTGCTLWQKIWSLDTRELLASYTMTIIGAATLGNVERYLAQAAIAALPNSTLVACNYACGIVWANGDPETLFKGPVILEDVPT
jgi:hypothetical protein